MILTECLWLTGNKLQKGHGMKRYGFSIIELMIVVSIIAFLALLSMPSMNRFIAKAKRAEAYVYLHALYAAQKSYWAEHGRYSPVLYGPNGIGWRPEGYKGGGQQEQFYYTYGIGSGTEGVNYFTGKLSTPHTHLQNGRADNQRFVVVAAGDVMGNGRPDILAIDENNQITIIQDGING